MVVLGTYWGHHGWVGDTLVGFRAPWLGWGRFGDLIIGLGTHWLGLGHHGWVWDLLGTPWLGLGHHGRVGDTLRTPQLGWGHRGWVGDTAVRLGSHGNTAGPPLTLVGQVAEIEGGAALAVGGALQLHADGDRVAEGALPEGRRAEHDGNLAVYVGRREAALRLPALSPETNLDVLCRDGDGLGTRWGQIWGRVGDASGDGLGTDLGTD